MDAPEVNACSFCEEEFPITKFKPIPGYWVKPYPDIEWDGTFDGMPSSIFTAEVPELGVALLCPNGCLNRELREVSDG